MKIIYPLILIVFLSCLSVYGQLPENNAIDKITEDFRRISSYWRPVIYRAAISLFWSLALIEICWTGIIMLLKQADLQEFIGELVKRVLYIGFFLFLLENNREISLAIINSFKTIAMDAVEAGNMAEAEKLAPANIFDSGLDIAKVILLKMSFFNPTIGLGYLIASIIIIICFALISSHLVVAIIEMYIVTNAGFILLGFGPNRYTKELALSYLKYMFSVGIKLFIIHLIIGIGELIVHGWVSTFTVVERPQILVMIAVSIVFLALVREIPAIINGIIAGVTFTSGNSLIASTTQMLQTIVKAAAAATGAGMAVVAAAEKVEKVVASQEGTGTPSSGSGKMAQMITGMTKELATGTKEGIAEKLSKTTMGGLIAKKIAQSSNKRNEK